MIVKIEKFVRKNRKNAKFRRFNGAFKNVFKFYLANFKRKHSAKYQR